MVELCGVEIWYVLMLIVHYANPCITRTDTVLCIYMSDARP